jgi:hypothetical protein
MKREQKACSAETAMQIPTATTAGQRVLGVSE